MEEIGREKKVLYGRRLARLDENRQVMVVADNLRKGGGINIYCHGGSMNR